MTAANRTIVACWRAPSGWIYTQDSDGNRIPWGADVNDPRIHRYLTGHGLQLGDPHTGSLVNTHYPLVPLEASTATIIDVLTGLVARLDNVVDQLAEMERDRLPVGYPLEDVRRVLRDLVTLGELVDALP
jgi:hypothetical protein